MVSSKSVLLCALFVYVCVSVVRADVDIITRICKFDWCYDLDENNATYSGVDYHRKLAQLFASGVPQLLYQDVPTLFKALDGRVSDACRKSVAAVSKAIDNGLEWAFRGERNENAFSN